MEPRTSAGLRTAMVRILLSASSTCGRKHVFTCRPALKLVTTTAGVGISAPNEVVAAASQWTFICCSHCRRRAASDAAAHPLWRVSLARCGRLPARESGHQYQQRAVPASVAMAVATFAVCTREWSAAVRAETHPGGPTILRPWRLLSRWTRARTAAHAWAVRGGKEDMRRAQHSPFPASPTGPPTTLLPSWW